MAIRPASGYDPGQMNVYLNQIETAVPPYEGHDKFTAILPKLLSSENDRRILQKAVEGLGIEKRYSVLNPFFDAEGDQPLAFYRPSHFPSTGERMKAYQQNALPLASLALEPLFSKLSPESITHLIVTSCTGFYAPGLDVDIIRRFRLQSTVERSFIGYMGCYAAISALRLAQHIVRSRADAKVLMVNTEICTLHWRKNVPVDQLISYLLFADGCAAGVISSEPAGLQLESFYTNQLPESLDLMKWTIGDDGFFMNLDYRIPLAIQSGLEKSGTEVLRGGSVQNLQLWAIHPGGKSILDAVETGLRLPPASLKHSREVLKNYGNMSSPTVMFVLQRIMADPDCRGRGCAMAFGPGLTLESFLFEKIGDVP